MPRLAIDENEIGPKEFKFANDLIDELSAVVRVKNFGGPNVQKISNKWEATVGAALVQSARKTTNFVQWSWATRTYL